MTTTSWILLGLLVVMMSIVATIMVTRVKTEKDREEVIDDTVQRLTFG